MAEYTYSSTQGITLNQDFAAHAPKYNKWVSALAWSPDGQAIAVAYYGQTGTGPNALIDILNPRTGQLLHTLEKPQSPHHINSLSWSPDGQMLAVGSTNFEIWHMATKRLLHTFNYPRSHVSWSPNGKMLALSTGNDIELRDAQTGSLLQTLPHWNSITCIAWSPTDSSNLASRSQDRLIRIWNAETGQVLFHRKETEERLPIYSNIAWSPNGKVLAWGDGFTVSLYNTKAGQINYLEGLSYPITCLAFSSDGSLLATRSIEGSDTVYFWHDKTKEAVATLKYPLMTQTRPLMKTPLTFSPRASMLADIDEEFTTACIWNIDLKTILGITPTIRSVHYTNAKVILLGDSSVGKSGLALVLTHKPFAPTESTHARHVWTLDSQDIELDDGRKMTRETLLWDLAGQPGYRLIHQLHLNEVAVALVVFDGRSETDPFAGVYHWRRAIEQAQRVQSSTTPPIKKFLVAARMDRGGIGVSRERIQELTKELGFDSYFETSAKEGWGIAELRQAIQTAIAWEKLPQVSSTQLLQQIKDFLLAEKEAGRLQSTVDDLYRTFLRSKNAPEQTADMQKQFEACIGRVESRGLIRRLSFGNLLLLQPERLDAYASALINAVKEEPDGLGSIAEEKVLRGQFLIPQDERIRDKEQEKLLLIAMLEDLLRYEIALREQADDGPYLIFPSQSTREHPNLPDPEGKTTIFRFEGPVLHIYATLAVRLSHSGMFKKKELWKNAATYIARAGGTCGIFLRNIGEGRGELTLFFQGTSEETSYHFDEYVEAHLLRRALPETVKRQRIFACHACGFVMPEKSAQQRRQRGYDWFECPVCGTGILLRDKEERLAAVPPSQIQTMDRAADKQRDSETAQSILRGKRTTNDFDVFLCHNEVDKVAVRQVGEWLKKQGILPWLAEWEIRPGQPVVSSVEQQIGQIKSAAVFVGSNALEPWRQMEVEALLREFVSRSCPVIPVLLPNAPQQPQLPIFLKGMRWVDFRERESDPFQLLIWGITGKQRITM